MTRRELLASTPASSAVAEQAVARKRPLGNQAGPNILVFFTDQQRCDTLGCYGGPMGLTPNLDRFARDGVRFEHAFTNQPLCAPARSVLQTGKYATTTGVINNGLILRDDERTLANYFGQRGYQTAYVGKWHLGGTSDRPVPVPRRGGYQWWAASDVLEFTSTPFQGRVFDTNDQPVEFSQYRTDALTDIAIRFLREREEQRGRRPDRRVDL